MAARLFVGNLPRGVADSALADFVAEQPIETAGHQRQLQVTVDLMRKGTLQGQALWIERKHKLFDDGETLFG